MDIEQSNYCNRSSKKPRLGESGNPIQNGLSLPELDRIQQSENQLSFLQAQLTATGALYAAYQVSLAAPTAQFICHDRMVQHGFK
jgi:hypothetical protein